MVFFLVEQSAAEEKKMKEEKKRMLLRKLSFRPTVEELKEKKVCPYVTILDNGQSVLHCKMYTYS
jgi:phosphatase and actin regulator 4